jgi:hypothetical protein
VDRALAGVSLALLLGCTGSIGPVVPESTTLWPLEAGARWSYRTPAGELDVEARLPVAGEPGAQVVLVSRGPQGERDEWLVGTPPFALLLAAKDDGVDEQISPFAVAGLVSTLPEVSEMSSDYQRAGVAVHEHWRVVATHPVLTVAAGTFRDVVELERSGPDGVTRSFWAPGVGELSRSGAGARELVHFTPAPEKRAAPR